MGVVMSKAGNKLPMYWSQEQHAQTNTNTTQADTYITRALL
jgi:hypothetical protein